MFIYHKLSINVIFRQWIFKNTLKCGRRCFFSFLFSGTFFKGLLIVDWIFLFTMGILHKLLKSKLINKTKFNYIFNQLSKIVLFLSFHSINWKYLLYDIFGILPKYANSISINRYLSKFQLNFSVHYQNVHKDFLPKYKLS